MVVLLKMFAVSHLEKPGEVPAKYARQLVSFTHCKTFPYSSVKQNIIDFQLIG